jgi:hypothetical protein
VIVGDGHGWMGHEHEHEREEGQRAVEQGQGHR